MRILLFGLLFISQSFSLTINQKESLRVEIAERIQNILNSYDTSSKVDVEIEYKPIKPEKNNIKANPFLLTVKEQPKPTRIQDTIQSIQLSIFSKKEEVKIPKIIKSQIVSTLYSYSQETKIRYHYLQPEPVPAPVIVKVDNSVGAQFKRLNLFQRFFISFSVLAFFSWVIISLMGVAFKKKKVSPQKNNLTDRLDQLTSKVEQAFTQQLSTVPVQEKVPTPQKPDLKIVEKDQFVFTHEQEEIDFFAKKPTDFTVIHLFPSLGWLTMLSHQDLKEVLAQFTAEELAIAWEGPLEFRTQLANNLTLEKREQLELFRPQISSNRENAVFRELMISAEKKLRTKKSDVA